MKDHTDAVRECTPGRLNDYGKEAEHAATICYTVGKIGKITLSDTTTTHPGEILG